MIYPEKINGENVWNILKVKSQIVRKVMLPAMISALLMYI